MIAFFKDKDMLLREWDSSDMKAHGTCHIIEVHWDANKVCADEKNFWAFSTADCFPSEIQGSRKSANIQYGPAHEQT